MTRDVFLTEISPYLVTDWKENKVSRANEESRLSHVFKQERKKKIDITKVGHTDSGMFEDDESCWLYFCFHPFLKWTEDVN